MSPPWPVQAIALGAVGFVLIYPFLGRRNDWIGRLVLGALFAFAFALWAAIAWRWTTRALEWWRDRPA
ncbi:hypothetical protein [Paludisphaera soli]|uniref:hypothetical protein n=1 Tax=Paludisphaera soli TaxID=2712865 RepID=UPI0013EAAE45|nr:hypothetical protein [Paludisphaera soli]